jgi:peptidyl-prolyl cis-trans isomerase A (cyclophilin A)
MAKGFFTFLMAVLFMFSGLSLAADKKLAPGTYVVFDTTMGKITCIFYEKEAPKTVQNFIGLAEGTKEWTDPKTNQKVKKHFYDGLIFHRVIPNFMAQGGDPLGIGVGGPGYQFEDEFSPKLRFDGPGRLAMANAGPGTNGSQFFITQVATPWLDGRHTIFGQVVEGQEVIDKMAGVPKGPGDKPITDIVMKKVSILRVK